MKKEKGFTLVELLVVIAILAILAAVSVVGYLSFTKKANLSNDQTTIKMLNDNLMAEFVEEKPKTAGEAMTRLHNLGITKEKLVAYSNDYHYAYNLDDNMFVLLDENNNAVYPEGASKDGLWGLYMGSESDLVSVSNYVIFSPILRTEEINFLLDEGNITIDLNNLYIAAKDFTSNSENKITLMNGSCVIDQDHNNFIISEDNDINEMDNYVTKSTVSNLLNKEAVDGVVSIDNVILDFTEAGGGMQIQKEVTTKFNNCVFLAYNKNDEKQAHVITFTDAWPPVNNDDPFPKDNSKLEIYNSEFLGLGGLCTDILNVVVENSTFINGNGGIDLQAPTTKAVMKNNIFDFSNSNKSSYVISISNREYIETPEDYNDRKYNIEFTGNKVINSDSIIKFHENCYIKHDGFYNAVDPKNITISNNNIKNKSSNYVVGSINKETNELYDIPEALQNIMNSLNAKF